jgi:predicted N-acetyltransferase YhbS
MHIQFRHYLSPKDYQRVDDFLIAHYQPGNRDGNWLEPMWEYMHGHPYLDQAALERIGLWEDDGQLVAVAHYESRLGEAFFQFHPAYRHLRQAMLEYAEQNVSGGPQRDGRRALRAYINELDEDFQSLARARGYQREPESDRPLFQVAIPHLVPAIRLPAGFHLTSLADECDWARVHRVLWRGFNHDGEPPAAEGELESRRKMFDTPTARRDLKIVVTSPAGDFVSFCGMFYVPAHQYAYVEPVATDPAYRRRGLGQAAVLEGLRRCGALGAAVAYVGSDQEFYRALGFTKVFTNECWVKSFDDGQ